MIDGRSERPEQLRVIIEKADQVTSCGTEANITPSGNTEVLGLPNDPYAFGDIDSNVRGVDDHDHIGRFHISVEE